MAESDIERIMRKIKERDARLKKKNFYKAKMKRKEVNETDPPNHHSD